MSAPLRDYKRNFLKPEEITSSLLSTMLNNLKKDEEICMRHADDGRVEIYLRYVNPVSNKREVRHFRNSLFLSTGSLPLKSQWFSINDTLPNQVKINRERKSQATAKRNDRTNNLKVISGALAFAIACMGKEQSTIVSAPSGKYISYRIGDKDVFTKDGETPLMYKVVGDRDYVYLPA